jgi:phage tail tape-measure protein
MTPEQRLDRVERILGYFVREGRRWRVRSREQNEKINILIHFQMQTTEQIAASHALHEKEMAELRSEQKLTQQSLRAFIDSLRKERNGKSSDRQL